MLLSQFKCTTAYKESLQNKHNRGVCELNDAEDKELKSEQELPGADDSWSNEPAARPVAEQTREESAREQHRASSNSQQTRSKASPKRGKPQSSARAPTSDFLLWTQEFEPREWEEFLSWKAEQAPATVSDPFGWAYNTLKADLERARLSLKSFRLQADQLPSGQGSEADGTLNFATWERARHVELAQQYMADTVAFLRQQSWHSSWVEYVNANFPALFAEVYQGDR